ncbi:hypothetical protein [Komagataeibacter kakiaceti]|uniref:hypothetical protein n=1 Tax=Komagataeibacter kakiaceti TaxID=943261 RepID=UPI0011DD5036|nr:hypothetical protein [Komagataeibacter kakiaceti]
MEAPAGGLKRLPSGQPANPVEVYGGFFSKSFGKRRLFGKRRHPKTFTVSVSQLFLPGNPGVFMRMEGQKGFHGLLP